MDAGHWSGCSQIYMFCLAVRWQKHTNVSGLIAGGGGSGRDRELRLIRHSLEEIYKEIPLNSIKNYV